jgi:5-methylcytosine-specific restriction endonuclease McrA
MKSTGQYPANWQDIAFEVKARAGWRCEHCGRRNGPGRVLTVHHLDGDKSNCDQGNLVALCQVCHLHWQAKLLPGQVMMDCARPAWLEERGLGV